MLRKVGKLSANFVAGFVFPATCAGCGCSGTWMCHRCARTLESLDLMKPYRIVHADGNLVDPIYDPIRIVARFSYQEPVRRAIHLVKYDGQFARSEWLAAQVAPIVNSLRHGSTVIEPVPLTTQRSAMRGFNQSTEIAKHLASMTGIQYQESLTRVRETRPQVELSGIDRIANVRGAFAAADSVQDRHVVVIDDVATTGATLRECARACYAAGAKAVVGVAVASGGAGGGQ